MNVRADSVGIPVDQPLRCSIDPDSSAVPAREQFDLFRSWNEGLEQPCAASGNACIRRKRLLGTRDAPADSSDKRRIAGIAEEWDFADASTCSRMFRAEFGMSPREAREPGRQGVRHSEWPSMDQPIGHVGGPGNLLVNNSLGLSLSSKR